MRPETKKKYERSLKLLDKLHDSNILYKTWDDTINELLEYESLYYISSEALKKIKDLKSYVESLKEKQLKNRESGLKLVEQIQDQTAKEVILSRYRDCKDWETIADDQSYCQAHIYRYFYKGLEELEELLKNQEI